MIGNRIISIMNGLKQLFSIPLMLVWGFFSNLNAMENAVVLDSIRGIIEIQHGGSTEWHIVTDVKCIENNDIVKTSANGFARIRWPDSSSVSLRSNSKLLVTLFKSGTTGVTVHRTTLYYGEAFFLSGKLTPQRAISQENKVFTPTQVLGFKGTSFLVKVAQRDGSTETIVLHGLVSIKDVKAVRTSILKAPYKSFSSSNSEHLRTAPLLTDDIDQLKTWIYPAIIEKELHDEFISGKRTSLLSSGKFEEAVLLKHFKDNTSDVEFSRDAARCAGEELAKKLSTILPGFKIGLDSLVSDSILNTAREKGFRFAIEGTLFKYGIEKKAEISLSADEYREYTCANVGIHFTFWGVPDQEILDDRNILISIKLKKSDKELPENKTARSPDDPQFKNSVMSSAWNQCIDSLSNVITNFINR